MSVWEALAILGVGLLAGTVNTIVGSGSLITFPTLLAFGYAPVTANVSNTVGLAFGAASGSLGYRRELRGQTPPRPDPRVRIVRRRSARRHPAPHAAVVGLRRRRPRPHPRCVRARRRAAAPERVGGEPPVGARRARRAGALGVRLRDGRVRRLLRRRAGRDPALAARHLHLRQPATTQRREERARADRERRGRGAVPLLDPHRVGGVRAARRRLHRRRPDRRAHRPPPPRAAGSAP